jgi:hypothetical protein
MKDLDKFRASAYSRWLTDFKLFIMVLSEIFCCHYVMMDDYSFAKEMKLVPKLYSMTSQSEYYVWEDAMEDFCGVVIWILI